MESSVSSRGKLVVDSSPVWRMEANSGLSDPEQSTVLAVCHVLEPLQSSGWCPCSPSVFSDLKGELREEGGLCWLDWVD